MPALHLTRLAYGVVLLTRPQVVPDASDPLTRGGARVLGARHAIEGALLDGRHRLLAGIDAIHVASMLALATRDHGRRRALLASAAISTALATAELRARSAA